MTWSKNSSMPASKSSVFLALYATSWKIYKPNHNRFNTLQVYNSIFVILKFHSTPYSVLTVIYNMLCTGTKPKRWSTSPQHTLLQLQVFAMAQYYSISMNNNTGILQLRTYLHIPQINITTRIKSRSFILVTMRQLAASSLSKGISSKLKYLFSHEQGIQHHWVGSKIKFIQLVSTHAGIVELHSHNFRNIVVYLLHQT